MRDQTFYASPLALGNILGGFGRFIDGKPVDKAQHKTFFPCHAAKAKGHDWFLRVTPLEGKKRVQVRHP